MLHCKPMQRLFDILEPVPWGWRVGILVMLVVIFIIAPLDLLLKRFAPRIANAKFGPEFPVLSKNGCVLFNAILYSIVAIGGAVILLLPDWNGKHTLGALLGIAAVVLGFAIAAIFEFACWRKVRVRKESNTDDGGKSSDDA